MNTKESATDADSQLTLFESSGCAAMSSTLHVAVATLLTIGDQNMCDVTRDTQQRWATKWRQRLREFDTIITE